MQNNSNLIFGPVNSRRFGLSLGIDLSPNSKQCNFDCLYCELKGAKTVAKQSNPIDVDLYIAAVKKGMLKYPEIDVITLTANGEPTLYPYLDELVDKLNNIKQNKKLLILTNGSLIYDEKIRTILYKIDMVKISMDCVSKECFKKLDRLDNTIDSNQILEGLLIFADNHTKDMIIEVLFVDTINNKEQEIQEIYTMLKRLNPTRVDIGTIDRPPAYDVKPIDYEQLKNIASKFEGLNISIAHKNKIALNKFLSQDEILNLLDKRPQTQDDIDNLLDTNSKQLFEKLIQNHSITTKIQAGVVFFTRV